MTGQLRPQVVFKKCLKLDAEQPPLGQHTAALLEGVAEVRLERVVHQHQRLAEEQAVLGAADVKCVAVFGEILRLEVVCRADQRRAHARAVEVEIKPQLPAGL